MGLPKVVEWSLDFRDGRRVAVPGLNPGVSCPPFGNFVGESMGKEQELIGTSLLVGSDVGLILASCSGVEVCLLRIWFFILGKNLGTTNL